MFMIIKKAMVYNITTIFVSRPVLKALLMMMMITVVGLSFASCSKEKAEPERLVNVRRLQGGRCFCVHGSQSARV